LSNLHHGDKVKVLVDGQWVEATLTHPSLQLPRGMGEAWHFTLDPECPAEPGRDWAPAKDIKKAD
jgi:hypothetical protein